MAVSPVKPSDFEAVIPAASDTPCEKQTKFIEFIGLVRDYIAWELTEDGQLSDEFLEGIGASAAGLTAPAGISATENSTTGITVTWAAVTGAATYSVYRGSTSVTASMTLLASNLTTTTYSDLVADPDGPDQDVTYWYSVRAHSSTANSGYGTPDSGKAPTSVSGGDPVTNLYKDPDVKAVPVPSGKTSLELKMWGGGGDGGVKSGWHPIGSNPGPGSGGASGSYLHITGITVNDTQTFYLKIGKKDGSSDGGTYVYRGEIGSTDRVRATGGGNGNNADGDADIDGGSAAASYGDTTIGGTIVTGAGESSVGNDGTNGGSFGGDGTGGAALSRGGLAFGAGGNGSSDTSRSHDRDAADSEPDGNYGGNGAIWYKFT